MTEKMFPRNAKRLAKCRKPGEIPVDISFADSPTSPAVLLFHGLKQDADTTWKRPGRMEVNWAYDRDPERINGINFLERRFLDGHTLPQELRNVAGLGVKL